MNIPSWIIQKRSQQCGACHQQKQCTAKFKILSEIVECPRNIIRSVQEEIASKAWPEQAPRVSGCCDSALNYE